VLPHRLVPSREEALARVASRLKKASALVREARFASGVPELDRVLGGSGLARGSLVDLHAPEGGRALALALAIAGKLCHEASLRAIVLLDTTGDFYPPAAAQAGIDLARLVVVRPSGSSRRASREMLSALDEALRSKAVGAAVARVRGLDPGASHRLRVAAEAGGGVGLLLRPIVERTSVSAAAVRLLLEPRLASQRAAASAWTIVPLRIRGGSES
jgi:protein ImuA